MNRIVFLVLAVCLALGASGCVDLIRADGPSLQTWKEEHVRQPFQQGYRYAVGDKQGEAQR